MSIVVKDSGTYQPVQQVFTKQSGIIEEVREVYVNNGGEWKQVFNNYEAVNITISTNINDYDVKAELLLLGKFPGTTPYNVNIIIDNSITVSATSSSFALKISDTWIPDTIITITNNGTIQGQNGFAGDAILLSTTGAPKVIVVNNDTISGGDAGTGNAITTNSSSLDLTNYGTIIGLVV